MEQYARRLRSPGQALLSLQRTPRLRYLAQIRSGTARSQLQPSRVVLGLVLVVRRRAGIRLY